MFATLGLSPLPPETIHLPFEAGPYRMAMGLVTVPEPQWFEIDERYLEDIETYRSNPPGPDWNGVTTYKTK